MKVAYKTVNRLSSSGKTVLDIDETEIETDLNIDDLEFFGIVSGKVKRKSAVDIAAIMKNRSIAAIKKNIKQSRDLRKQGGVKVNEKWFHTDDASRLQQVGLLLMGVNIPPVQWKTMDESYITMTATIASQIFQAVAALDMTLFANCEKHIAAMSAAVDPESYDYSTGWPEHFPI